QAGVACRNLIGRLASVAAKWDIEPEEVNGFELTPPSIRRTGGKAPETTETKT
ncbi:MAG: hypothetical protein ACI8QZ_004034, partial [Chlamydiales bacterium]